MAVLSELHVYQYVPIGVCGYERASCVVFPLYKFVINASLKQEGATKTISYQSLADP